MPCANTFWSASNPVGKSPSASKQVRTLAENSPDIIVRYDREGRYLYANPAFATATGLLPAKVTGRRIAEFAFFAEYIALWERTLERVFASGQPVTVEFESQDARRAAAFRVAGHP